MIVRKTTPQETLRTDELFCIAFEFPLDRAREPDTAPRPGVCHWAAFADDAAEMMSTFTITEFPIRFDGSACRMGGIGGVATLPQYRRRGGIRGCFNAALPDMYENGFDFSYLYPFSTAYYRKFGYENCVRKYAATVHLGLLAPPAAPGYFRLNEAGRPLAQDIRALDAVWERKFNMMVLHTEKDYAWAEAPDPAATQEFTYVCYSEAGEPNAYTTFRKEDEPDGRNLVCSRFCFADKQGYTALMQLFKSLSADHAYAKFSLPADPALMYMMPEWSLGAAAWAVRPAGMVRVVNARQVLEKARCIGSGALVLEIRDEQIAQNNGRFAVVFAGGQVVSVTQTAADPDAVFDITAFSALITGAADLADARGCLAGIEVKNVSACFERIFYRKPLFITTPF